MKLLRLCIALSLTGVGLYGCDSSEEEGTEVAVEGAEAAAADAAGEAGEAAAAVEAAMTPAATCAAMVEAAKEGEGDKVASWSVGMPEDPDPAAKDAMMKAIGELGISPTSQARVSKVKHGATVTRFEAFLAGKVTKHEPPSAQNDA